ncbi:POTRA domain-containing protein [Acidicapsa dinghuensis]|uniref:POTRA domain-containing protein n=1 Tax=Acidicapsa dinghuensis TaxID=2218256 RepID=UPI0021DFC3D0|nr:POTRA domain-containing protein [Acidicapsa dinghuensis]
MISIAARYRRLICPDQRRTLLEREEKRAQLPAKLPQSGKLLKWLSLASVTFLWCGYPSRLVAQPQTAQQIAQTDAAEVRRKAADTEQTSTQLNASSPRVAEPPDRLDALQGKTVLRIEFEGVRRARLEPLPIELAQQSGKPLNPTAVRDSLRRLYATGVYDTIAVESRREAGGVILIFSGQPRTFIGLVSVIGAKGANINSLLARASGLTPGNRFTDAGLVQAEEEMKKTLAANGWYQATITHTLTPHPAEQLVDIAFTVNSRAQARTGDVSVQGDSGLTLDEFRRQARLRAGHTVDRDTSSRALGGMQKYYRKNQRLEADVKLESQNYVSAKNDVDFNFSANRGPIVHVIVDGVSLSDEKVRKLVPIYEEGSVDEDLLNEGNQHLQNYYQRLGYFDARVRHEEKNPSPDLVEILFTVHLGARHRVIKVSVDGNKYFDRGTLEERLSVRAHDAFSRQGVYNQALIAQDISAIQAVYQNNGFTQVKVTQEIQDEDNNGQSPKRTKQVGFSVVYHIDEGPQERVHSVTLVGTQRIAQDLLIPLLNTAAGQPLSPQNLAGDREALLTYYLSRGFEQADVEVSQAVPHASTDTPHPDETHTAPGAVDVTFRIHEGEQVFLRRVITTGLHYTHPKTIARAITLKEGEPLDETALVDTQRNLYDLALFNEVNPVIENPNGEEPRKTVLLQTTEARRWDIAYGVGLEAQTGTVNGSNNSNPNGTVGISPRVLLQVSRINLFGRDQTASIRGNYGLLEQRVDLVYQYPHLFGNRNFSFSFNGGYNNSQDVITYSASKLEGSLRLTEHFNGPEQLFSKANTFIYQFIYRRVKVDQNSIQVPLDEIPLLSEAVRVGGPSFTWIRDTRDAPLDAHRGTYTSFQEFISSAIFDSEANFNQVDVSNSSYYTFDHDRLVLARNTRYGQERAYGQSVDELIPLPERLYAGGGNSHRGFGVNSAGPRDPQSGFPIGGAGVFVNSTELRMPPPTLPLFGNTLSFVLFHDMGNAFRDSGDIWPSIARFRQPDRAGCRNLTPGPPSGKVTSTGTEGSCSFNYFSHAVGLGARYHTPVGPVRLDFSWNLNPPIYPVTYDTVTDTNLTNPYVGEGSHFNFFFSLGQSF